MTERSATGALDACRVAVFARAPVLGQVKTRLAGTIGDRAALAAHEELVAATLSRLSGAPGFRLELWIAGDVEHPQVLRWSQEFGVAVRAQRGADLGSRMSNAFESLTSEGGPGVLVGCDCPPIDRAYVQEAVAALAEHDLVLGPAEDGGYGLIGLRRAQESLFLDVPWGTSRVLDVTLGIARKLGLSVRMLERIWDVDTSADWARYLGNFSPGQQPG